MANSSTRKPKHRDVHEQYKLAASRLENSGFTSAGKVRELVESAYSCGLSDGLDGVNLADFITTELNEVIAWAQDARAIITGAQ